MFITSSPIGKIFSSLFVPMMMQTFLGGSSNVFKSLFCADKFIVCPLSIKKSFVVPSMGLKKLSSTSSAMSFVKMFSPFLG